MIPAGAILVVPVQLVQMDDSSWGSDANQFNRYCFLSKAEKKSNIVHVMPFAGSAISYQLWCVYGKILSVRLASCLMMIRQRNNIIAMAVVYAGCCYSVLLKNSHPCVEGAMHNDCPVCFEYLFESRNDVTVMPCGHTIHKICLKEMYEHYEHARPLCSKSVCDMSKVWEKFDMEIAATPMSKP